MVDSTVSLWATTDNHPNQETVSPLPLHYPGTDAESAWLAQVCTRQEVFSMSTSGADLG